MRKIVQTVYLIGFLCENLFYTHFVKVLCHSSLFYGCDRIMNIIIFSHADP